MQNPQGAGSSRPLRIVRRPLSCGYLVHYRDAKILP